MTTQERICIPFVDFRRRYTSLRAEILAAVDEVFSSGIYILGDFVTQLETQLSQYLNAPYVLGVANGADALMLGLRVLNVGRGDEVIVPVNSFIASAGAVVAAGATPVFCDVTDDLNIDVNQIKKHITKKTKAIMPVHLAGRPADMNTIMRIAQENQLSIIEDAAQSIGATYRNKMTGTMGDIGCFSLHPLKNLHAYGDAGIIVAKNKTHYEQLKLLRNHGLADRDRCVLWGYNSRIDAVQARLVSLGLVHLNEWNDRRRQNAMRYMVGLKNRVTVPQEHPEGFSVYHNFILLTKQRNALASYLQEHGIDTRIHYPTPLHLQPAAQNLGYQIGDFPVSERLANEMLSLPIYPELSDEHIDYVIERIQGFFDGN